MHDREEAKRDLIEFVRERYSTDEIESRKIGEFAATYTADAAVKWFTRDSFVYRMLNQALRRRDMNTLYLFRLLIIDIHSALNGMKNIACHSTSIVHLYRGQMMAREEIEQLRLSVDNYISMNSFLSTSAERHISLFFAGEHDGLEAVLINIRADKTLVHAKPFADITAISYFQDEEETLFMLGSVFRLLSVEFDPNEQRWLLQLELCSDDDTDIKPVLDRLKDDIEEKTDSYELGRIMIEMGDTTSAEQYLQRFIQRETPNRGTMGGCYMLLGNIEMEKGNVDNAIHYHRHGLELKQRYLPADHPYIPYSHNNLGQALHVHGDLDEALEQFNEALRLWRHEYVNDMHKNISLCLHNIGCIHNDRDEFELALANLNQAYEIRHKCLGLVHSDTATTLKCIASVYGNANALEQVESLLEKALQIQRSCLPSTHMDIADTLHHLGVHQMNARRPDRALVYFQEAMEILRQTVPATHRFYREVEEDIRQVQTIEVEDTPST